MFMFAPGIWFLLALASLFVIGFVALLRSASKVESNLEFTAEYREKFHAFVDQDDSSAYAWLTLNANRMQAQMGSEGLMTFKPPFANHMIQNYPVVLNVLPEVRKCLTDELLSRTLLNQYASLLDETLMRYQGSLLERHRQAVGLVKNPVVWLASGIRSVLAVPIWFLASAGVLPRSFASRILGSSVYRVLSGLVATIGFISAIVGLVTGWEQFAVILRKLVPGAF
jgi:hypothetical protein